MTPSAPAQPAATTTPCQWQESWGTFANWAAERLGLTLEFTTDGFCLGEKAGDAAPAVAAARSGLGSSLFSRRKKTADQATRECYRSTTELAAALLARFATCPSPPDLAPRDQPEQLHDIAPRLTSAYQVDGGGLHIAGCSFTDVPFFRITTVDEAHGEPVFSHTLLDSQGNLVDSELATQLGLTETKNCDHPPSHSLSPPDRPVEAALSAVMWAKWVTGCVQFTLGDASLATPFEGWARTLTAPPASCPLTGEKTFHLSALDDGQIVASEQAAPCEVTGRVLLKRDLAVCSVTGKRVAPELCETCPITNQPALTDSFAVCSRCGERVSRAALLGGRCQACRAMRSVTAAEPVLSAILSAYPGLASSKRWRLAETNSVYLLERGRPFRRQLLVLDRWDLKVRRALRLGPFGRTSELLDQQKQALLGG